MTYKHKNKIKSHTYVFANDNTCPLIIKRHIYTFHISFFQRKGRAAGLRLDKIQLYPSKKSHRWLTKRAEKKTGKKWGNTLKGVALGICTLLLAAMCLSVSQRAVTGCGELLGATVCGCGWQLGVPSIHRLVGTKRAVRYSVLRHIASHCNMLRQWKRPQTK